MSQETDILTHQEAHMKLGRSLLMLARLLTLKYEPTTVGLKQAQQKYELSSKAFDEALFRSDPKNFKGNFEEVRNFFKPTFTSLGP